MAITKQYTRHKGDAGWMENVQTITANGTRVSNYGVTVVQPSSDLALAMDAPVKGITKTLVGITGAGTNSFTLAQATTSITFLGTTSNLVTFSTTVTDPNGVLNLVGVSATQWALTSALPTGVTLSASTLSG